MSPPTARRRTGRPSVAALVAALLVGAAPGAQIMNAPEPPRVEWEQRLGEQVPLDAVLRDEDGSEVAFGELLGERPVVLALVYYECPMLCNLVLDGLVAAARELAFDAGEEYSVVAVSIDPGETPELARAKAGAYREAYGRGDGGWRFLVGEESAVRSIADAVGFGYTYVPETDEYAHGAGVSVLTPDGVLSRVLFGTDFGRRDLRLALVEASEGEIGSPVDALLLRCFHYDPEEGRYGFAILASLRIGGLLTVLVMGFFVFRLILRDRRRARAEASRA